METTKMKKTTYLNVNRDGNFYYKNNSGDKIIIPSDEQISNLLLRNIETYEGEYQGELNYRYIFTFNQGEEDEIKLSLNRYAHIGHLFCNKLCNCDLSKPMGISVFGKYDKESDFIHRIIMIYQDVNSVGKKFEQSEYPPIEDGNNDKRSKFFEEKMKELQAQLTPEIPAGDSQDIYSDKIEHNLDEEIGDTLKPADEKKSSPEQPEDDLPF